MEAAELSLSDRGIWTRSSDRLGGGLQLLWIQKHSRGGIFTPRHQDCTSRTRERAPQMLLNASLRPYVDSSSEWRPCHVQGFNEVQLDVLGARDETRKNTSL
ncbi:Ankyrin Repeat Domain-Containing Protein 42 [Manis pentadactyla]|nr:Ankyrin Repeat Domain-Containing Protein 42 [Manis pentadactyla]